MRDSHHSASFSNADMLIMGAPPDFCKAEDLGAFWFELLVPNNQAIAREPKYLHAIATPIEEEEQITGFYLLAQL